MSLEFFIPLIINFFTGFFVIAGIYIAYVRFYCHTFWTTRYQVPQIKSCNIFGNYGKVLFNKRSLTEQFKIFYESIPHPFIGTYFCANPILIVRDPELFDLDDDKTFEIPLKSWNNLKLNAVLRQLSSFFTPKTFDGMHKTLNETVLSLITWLDNEISSKLNNKICVKNILSRYSVDFVGNIIFGSEIHSIFNNDATFLKMTRKLMKHHEQKKLADYSKLSDFWLISDEPQVDEYFESLVNLVTSHREKNNVERMDLLQLLLQLRNGNEFQDGRWRLKVEQKEANKNLSIKEMTAILKDILKVVFDQSTSSLIACLVQLGRHHNEQRQIQNILKTGHLNYEDLNKNEILDGFIKETMRLHSPLSYIERKTRGSFVLPGTIGKPLPQGTNIFLPVAAINRDPKYYENPNEFILKRGKAPFEFSAYGKKLSFLDGLVEMSLKTVLSEILKKYEIKFNEDQPLNEDMMLNSSLNIEFKQRN